MLWAHNLEGGGAGTSIIGSTSSVSENGLVPVAGTASLDALLAERLSLVTLDLPDSGMGLV